MSHVALDALFYAAGCRKYKATYMGVCDVDLSVGSD